MRNNSQSLQSTNSNGTRKVIGRNEIISFLPFDWNRLQPPSKSLSPSSFLQNSSFDVPLCPSHWSGTCYLRTTPCSRIEESFSMEPRIVFTGRNDKECRPGSFRRSTLAASSRASFRYVREKTYSVKREESWHEWCVHPVIDYCLSSLCDIHA